ncbi:MAG: hypothetical protein GY702_11770 [Desulfobulbaceae bacterium]|nr:hypothetical protein [Desulfobulbaceae bacterium]
MQKTIFTITISCLVLLYSQFYSLADTTLATQPGATEQQLTQQEKETVTMLTSLLDLQKNLKEQIKQSKRKLKKSTSDAQKETLQDEISQLDMQLSGTINDFERIATGIEPALFAEKKPETFSWKDELSSLLEPAIKELKRFTIRARSKSSLKEKITELELLTGIANEAVVHLQKIIEDKPKKHVHKEVEALLPEWQNVEERLVNKLELAQRELANLRAQEVSLVESSSKSIKDFFRNRGLYLIMAIGSSIIILITCRLLYRLILKIYFGLAKKKEQRSFLIRLLHVIFQVLSIVFAVIGLFFVLYLAEDWFLLSMAIIFFLGMTWTIRQGLPRLWQQGRLMINIGSVREQERLILHGVPWHVSSINVFCKLVNPTLDMELRVPIEDLIGMASRPYNQAEPWFPCKKGDWVVVSGASRARVVSLSHEQVEVVQRGGKRITYPTETFLQACPVNLSRNFRLRVPFGVSYSLQGLVTSEVPMIMKDYLAKRMEQEGYHKSCLNLQVEFFQAGASSLDLIVLADFEGQAADICKRIERAIQKWCVECCSINDWEIPFPQLTVHQIKPEPGITS